MSVNTITRPLASEEGSGQDNFSLGKEDETPGIEGFVMEDVGRRILKGRAAIAGFDETYRTDRVMPRRVSGLVLSQTILGPENYLG